MADFPADMPESRPFIDDHGDLVVPADCPEEYRWWAGGRSLEAILTELGASKTLWERYSPEPYPEELRKENYPLLGNE
ncbi:hypothetical protein [Desulfocurvus sp. DL9XJH121]